ncbi:MAG: hypothetical protein J0I41_15455 [Filimonas sp.]|nr:hypothetical protein [Filimonas sp.]
MPIKKLAFLLFVLVTAASCQQLQAQQLKDGVPVDLNGLEVTFRIVNKETISSGGTNYDRYKVVASVKNNSGKSLNVRLDKYPDAASISGGKLVEVNCLNATGARLTSKRMTIGMLQHKVNVTYLARDKDGKLVNSTMLIVAGYYLDPGQSVEDNAIFIVPAGEEPKVTARTL